MTMKNGWIQWSRSLVQVFSLYVFGWIFWPLPCWTVQTPRIRALDDQDKSREGSTERVGVEWMKSVSNFQLVIWTSLSLYKILLPRFFFTNMFKTWLVQKRTKLKQGHWWLLLWKLGGDQHHHIKWWFGQGSARHMWGVNQDGWWAA